ncbi:unnamed protein product [Owenia fusiformis]|uniref:Uncharacterized protein n=1 Tax=Owenia fusiformis TaxID=6347 RepID=A0A8J1UP48_OWEFU|nr:unnamed protein product [Owenia fusiformis]
MEQSVRKSRRKPMPKLREEFLFDWTPQKKKAMLQYPACVEGLDLNPRVKLEPIDTTTLKVVISNPSVSEIPQIKIEPDLSPIPSRTGHEMPSRYDFEQSMKNITSYYPNNLAKPGISHREMTVIPDFLLNPNKIFTVKSEVDFKVAITICITCSGGFLSAVELRLHKEQGCHPGKDHFQPIYSECNTTDPKRSKANGPKHKNKVKGNQGNKENVQKSLGSFDKTGISVGATDKAVAVNDTLDRILSHRETESEGAIDNIQFNDGIDENDHNKLIETRSTSDAVVDENKSELAQDDIVDMTGEEDDELSEPGNELETVSSAKPELICSAPLTIEEEQLLEAKRQKNREDRQRRSAIKRKIRENLAQKRDRILERCAGKYEITINEVGDKKYMCGLCKWTARFKTTKDLPDVEKRLKKHMLHHEEKKYKCPKCKFDRASYVHLKSHLQEKHGPKKSTFVCDKCGELFNTILKLYTHKGTRHRKRYAVCPVCGKKYDKHKELRIHIECEHDGESLLPCPFPDCKQGFTSKGNLNRHMKSVHIKEREVCPYCGNRNTDLERHIARVHGMKPKEFVCNRCPFSTHRKVSLMNHAMIHTGMKPFKCNICKWACIKKDMWKTHMLKKHGYKNAFYCKICTIAKETKLELYEHQKTHDKNNDNAETHDTSLHEEKDENTDTFEMYPAQKDGIEAKEASNLQNVELDGEYSVINQPDNMENDVYFSCGECNTLYNTEGELSTHFITDHALNINPSEFDALKYADLPIQ